MTNPDQCQRCTKQYQEFYSPGHPDHGRAFACGMMVAMRGQPHENVPCVYRTLEKAIEVPACKECIVTRPACGGCAPVIDAEKSNAALRMVAQIRKNRTMCEECGKPIGAPGDRVDKGMCYSCWAACHD